MADPTIQTFCCHNKNHSSLSNVMDEFNKQSYILVCLFSSGLGIAGALYQIFLRNEKEFIDVDGRNIRNTGRRIIIWLSVSDLCAALGIFFRSASWKFFQTNSEIDDTSVLFCAISSAWAQYFYTCTWIWTFCYAVDVRFILKKKRIKQKWFHLITWTTSALLTGIGLSALYIPNANCHDISYISTALTRILPNYIVTYLPITIVMIGNPILYFTSSCEINRQLSLTLNQVTTREREIMNIFKLKFSLINAVFYCCWLPNIISGVLLWVLWKNLPIKTIITFWYIMAITNPLQAFLNALVYRKWDNFKRQSPRSRSSELVKESYDSRNSIQSTKLSEKSPLLQSQPNTTSTINLPAYKIYKKFSVNSCCST